jgi:hypothetical protein
MAKTGSTLNGGAMNTHSARLTQPLRYEKPDGKSDEIPVGPCLVEQIDDHVVAIIWGTAGQSSAELPVEKVTAAATTGNLVLLD